MSIYINKLKSFCLSIALLLAIINNTTAQTAGSGTLSSIESKADMISKNDNKVAELNRQHLETYSLESEKLTNLKRELNSLIAEKASVLDEYRRGQFCTGCNIPRSQFAPGETFPHSGQSVRAATPEELAAKEKFYDDKIAAKSKEAKEFEFSENEFTRKRADIDKQMNNLKDQNDKLRAEIVELSKSYKDKVVAEGKSISKPWINSLMQLIAEKHVIEDKIDILKVKSADLETEEANATANMKEKVKRQNEKDIEDLNNKIAAKRSQLQSIEDLYRQRSSSLNETLGQQNQRLQEVKKLLLKPDKLKQEELESLTREQADLEARIESTQKDLADLKTTYEKDRDATKAEIKQADDKIWDLTINLSKRQENSLAALKDAFASKRQILSDAIIARKVSLQQTGDHLLKKKDAARQYFIDYTNKIEPERVRLISACNKAGASCYGMDTKGTVTSNWNTALGCVGEMEGNRSIGTYYGCEEEADVYQSHYRSLSSGLSDSDISALQRKTTKTRYDLIFQKVID